MLESLKIKTNKYYSYEEFLKNVKNISIIDSGQVNGICRTANLLFNDYVNDFHHFIVDNNVNYEAHYKKVCKNMTIITIQYFIKFCLSMNYNLSHDEEYKYLYINLSDDGKQLKQEVLYNFIKMPFTSEKEFIESGRLKQKKVKKTKPTKHVQPAPNDSSNETNPHKKTKKVVKKVKKVPKGE